MVEPWNDLYSTLLVIKWLMKDPWKDLSWIFFVMKRLKLDPWKDISSTLTRKLDRVIIVNIAPPLTRLPIQYVFSFCLQKESGIKCFDVSSVVFPSVVIVKFQLRSFYGYSNAIQLDSRSEIASTIVNNTGWVTTFYSINIVEGLTIWKD